MEDHFQERKDYMEDLYDLIKQKLTGTSKYDTESKPKSEYVQLEADQKVYLRELAGRIVEILLEFTIFKRLNRHNLLILRLEDTHKIIQIGCSGFEDGRAPSWTYYWEIGYVGKPMEAHPGQGYGLGSTVFSVEADYIREKIGTMLKIVGYDFIKYNKSFSVIY